MEKYKPVLNIDKMCKDNKRRFLIGVQSNGITSYLPSLTHEEVLELKSILDLL